MHQPFHDEDFLKNLDSMTSNELRLLWIEMMIKLLDEIDDLIEIEGVRDAADYLNRFFKKPL